MKTQSIFRDAFVERKEHLYKSFISSLRNNLLITVFTKTGHIPKIEIFNSWRTVVQLYCHFSETSCGTKGMIKYSKLTKGWIWNRTTVSKFISVLCCMGVAEIQKVGTEKIVSVKPFVLQWIDCSDIEAERHRDDSLQPQATPSQSSSSERSKTLSSEEKSLDN